VDMSLSKLQERVKDREVWHAAVQGVEKSGTQIATEQHQQCCKLYKKNVNRVLAFFMFLQRNVNKLLKFSMFLICQSTSSNS